MRAFVVLIVAAVTLTLLSAATTEAAQTGSAAWTLSTQTVYEGPGDQYDVLGTIDGKVRLRVDRCTYLWCQVHTTDVHGWVSRAELTFGKEPIGLFGIHLNNKAGGPGTVCLYDGHDYTGASICLSSGDASRDLLLQHLDNRFSSVTVEGNVSITLCRDRDFASYCQRVNESEPRLNGFLDGNVSSYRVH